MAITEAFTGSETVSTTEWSMTTDTAGPDSETADGIYQIFVDSNALTSAEVFECRVYEKVLSGSNQRMIYRASIISSSSPVWVSPSLILLHGWDATLIKVSGSDKNLDWSIRKVS